MPKKSTAAALRPRIRVVCGKTIALGPGKVDLLALVRKTGSIREAAEQMGMSYMRAWTLIKAMNACFNEPLVQTARGGAQRGGALLTSTGRKALALYQEMDADCVAAMKANWGELRKMLRP